MFYSERHFAYEITMTVLRHTSQQIHRNLSFIPPRLLTREVLDQFDQDGDTIIHLAAEYHCVHQLPPRAVTFRNFFELPNAYGVTTFNLISELGFDYFDEIRWDQMNCAAWLSDLPQLQSLDSFLFPDRSSNRFTAFVRRIEDFHRLKSEEPITLE